MAVKKVRRNNPSKVGRVIMLSLMLLLLLIASLVVAIAPAGVLTRGHNSTGGNNYAYAYSDPEISGGIEVPRISNNDNNIQTIAMTSSSSSSSSFSTLAGLYTWAINPRDAGMGIVGLSSMLPIAGSSSSCDFKLPAADPNRAGQSVTFKVPPGVIDIVNAGETNKPANYHIAFEGDDNLYYEVGIYYGDWSRESSIGYNASRFQIAWGVGGILKGVSNVPVIANHRLELSILYDSSGTKQWQVLINDLDSSQPIQAVNIGHTYMRVGSDYLTFLEAGSFAPNTNIQRLGLVDVLDIRQATMTSDNNNNKLAMSPWTNGYLVTTCSPANHSYGVTYKGSAGSFEIGYNGKATTNGLQLW